MQRSSADEEAFLRAEASLAMVRGTRGAELERAAAHIRKLGHTVHCPHWPATVLTTTAARSV